MISRSAFCSLVVALPSLLFASQGLAQDPSATAAGEPESSGAFAPVGPPMEPPVRVEAGGHCIIDLRQAYVMAGTLAGALEIDYRILVHGPCEVPPVLGKYDEEWIAYGTFTGTIDGTAASGSVVYTAQVRAGGEVEGRMRFGAGLAGEVIVSGTFSEGRLSYHGRVR